MKMGGGVLPPVAAQEQNAGEAQKGKSVCWRGAKFVLCVGFLKNSDTVYSMVPPYGNEPTENNYID